MSEVYDRANIRKDKGILALKKIAKITKNTTLKSTADALSLMSLDTLADFLKPSGNIGKDLLFFNHLKFDFSEEGVKEIQQMVSECVPHLIDFYRGVSAVTIYASTIHPPLPGLPDATKEDYEEPIRMMQRFCLIKDTLFNQPVPVFPVHPVKEQENSDKPDSAETQSTQADEKLPTTD